MPFDITQLIPALESVGVKVAPEIGAVLLALNAANTADQFLTGQSLAQQARAFFGIPANSPPTPTGFTPTNTHSTTKPTGFTPTNTHSTTKKKRTHRKSHKRKHHTRR